MQFVGHVVDGTYDSSYVVSELQSRMKSMMILTIINRII